MKGLKWGQSVSSGGLVVQMPIQQVRDLQLCPEFVRELVKVWLALGNDKYVDDSDLLIMLKMPLLNHFLRDEGRPLHLDMMRVMILGKYTNVVIADEGGCFSLVATVESRVHKVRFVYNVADNTIDLHLSYGLTCVSTAEQRALGYVAVHQVLVKEAVAQEMAELQAKTPTVRQAASTASPDRARHAH